jgi:HEAT repeat protein
MLRQILSILLIPGALACLPTQAARAAEKPADELLQQVVQLIGEQDREFRAAGLELVRTGAKGADATELFVAQLPKLDAEGQVALLNALADRADETARPAVIALASSSKDGRVRAAAIAAIGQLGSSAEIPLLIQSLSAGSPAEQNAARQSLIQLPGEATNTQLARELKSQSAAVSSKLIDVLATRRASSELAAFIEATVNDSAQVRSAAMNALGQLGRPDQIAAMLPGVLKAQPGGERDNAERNVALICARIGNEDERGTKLIEALDTVPEANRDQVLSLVGRVGGRKLINFVGDIATSSNPARRRLGIDALSNWPDASVADKLLEIANQAVDPGERNEAFQGYVKVAAARDNRNDKQRLERMKEAMKAAKNPAEQGLVLNRTRTAYDVESLRFVLPYVDQPQFAQVACETIVEIAHHREVRDPHKAEFDKALDKVIKATKDPILIDRAQRYKRGETWERPKKK